MTYKEIESYLIKGKIGMLPHYDGYFHWDYGKNQVYMRNDGYITYNLDNEKQRNDWYYII